MEYKFDLTEQEIRDIAKQSNKSVEEVIQEYKYALKDLEYSTNKINSIIDMYNYHKFPDNVSLCGYGFGNEFTNKYMCHDQLNSLEHFDVDELAIVTGFGPTSAPTAGTLASIFKVLELQKKTGIYTHIIISELSALNSRQKPLNELLVNTYQFINFIKKLGFDENKGEIRTHNYLDHSRTFSLISSVLKVEDLLEGEAMDGTYKRLEILGNDYSTMVSQVYTVADIVLPLIRDRKKGVVVPAGLEEHLYPYLARVAIDRIKMKTGGIESLVDPDAKIAALYGKLISGLFPYVKMSKSIPESSINLGDDISVLRKKIVECGERNEGIIYEMMVLASDWNDDMLVKAKEAFERREYNYQQWEEIKIQYYNFFVQIKKTWDESAFLDELDTYSSIFFRRNEK